MSRLEAGLEVQAAAERLEEGADPLDVIDDLVAWLTPVGAVEIAERLDVERATVDSWRQRGTFDLAPTWTVGGRPAWAWGLVARWARNRHHHDQEADNA